MNVIYCEMFLAIFACAEYNVTMYAGDGLAGYIDGIGNAARFNGPTMLAFDSKENLFVADAYNNRIRKITSDRVVTTYAGDGSSASQDGNGTLAGLKLLEGLKIDANDVMFVADTYNHKIRKVTPDGYVSTYAGGGVAGAVNGDRMEALFNNPADVAINSVGDVFVTDSINGLIRRISASDGQVTSLAGNGKVGNADGEGNLAYFSLPQGICVDSKANLFVSDSNNHKIRKITPSGVVTTFAGNGVAGFADGIGSNAMFNFPRGIIVDAFDNVYVADFSNNRIRKITPDGNVMTIAGDGNADGLDGIGTSASIRTPCGIAMDKAGNLFVSEIFGHAIRKLTLIKDRTFSSTRRATKSSSACSSAETSSIPLSQNSLEYGSSTSMTTGSRVTFSQTSTARIPPLYFDSQLSSLLFLTHLPKQYAIAPLILLGLAMVETFNLLCILLWHIRRARSWIFALNWFGTLCLCVSTAFYGKFLVNELLTIEPSSTDATLDAFMISFSSGLTLTMIHAVDLCIFWVFYDVCLLISAPLC